MEEPGVYGEYIPFDETEMTMRRAFGVGTPDNAFAMPVDLSDLTAKRQEQLLQRRINRIRWILWTLAVTGTFTVVGKNGSTVHQGTYLRQTFTSTVSWSTFATATPLQDFRTVKLLEWGHSVSFGSDAKAFANRRTINKMLANTNGADLYGRRVTGLSTINDLPSVNSFFTGDNLPSIQEYNAGYLTDGSVVQSASDMTQYGTFTPFIPDDYIVLFGSRPGNQRIGAFKFIRNVNNPGMAPGPYMKVVDSADGDDGPPRRIEIHDGFNGGPIIEYPSAVVTMHVHT
jgi:hypothetical protein